MVATRRHLAALAALSAFACTAPEPAPPPPNSHLGAVLGAEEPALAAPAGRTDADRARAAALVDEGAQARERGELAPAQAKLEEALRLDASLSRAHIEWSLTAEALGTDPALVSAHYRLGARLAPDDARAQLLAAAWAARQGEHDLALECFDRAVAAEPGNVEARTRRADLHVARGRLPPAIDDYRAALAVDAKHVPALVGLADSAERAAQHEVAEQAHKSLVALYPDNAHWRTRLVAFYRRTGQAAKAAAAERDLEKIDPGDTRKLRKLKKRK